MGEFRVEGPEIKKLLKVARRQPLNFAFNPAKADEDGYFALHRKKPAAKLGKDAKKDGEGTKYSFGSASLEGKILTLKVERELPQLAKKVKRFLKANSVVLNVQVLDVNGNVLESDIEEDLADDPSFEAADEDAASTTSATSEMSEDTADVDKSVSASDIARRLSVAKSQIADLPDTHSKKLETAIGNTVQQIKDNNLEAAELSTGKIEAALEKLVNAGVPSPPPPPDDQTLKVVQVLKNMKGRAEELDNADAKEAITGEIGRAAELIRSGDVGGAAGLLARIRDAIVAASRSVSEQIDEISKTENDKADSQPFAKARIDWINARDTMQNEIKKLQKAIVDTVGDSPDISIAVGDAGGLSSRLDVIDERLQSKLDSISNSDGDEERDALKVEARKIVAEYQRELEADFFKDVDQNNGFTNVAVASTAKTALIGVSRALV